MRFPRGCPIGLAKEGERAGVSMQKRGRAHRAYLAVAEKTTERNRPQFLPEEPGVVISAPKQVDSAPQAGEQQRAIGFGRAAVLRKEAGQILGSGLRVAKEELHHLPLLWRCADGNRAAVGIHADDVPHQKVAWMKLHFLGFHLQPYEERSLQERSVLRGERFEQLANDEQGGPPIQLEQHSA